MSQLSRWMQIAGSRGEWHRNDAGILRRLSRIMPPSSGKNRVNARVQTRKPIPNRRASS